MILRLEDRQFVEKGLSCRVRSCLLIRCIDMGGGFIQTRLDEKGMNFGQEILEIDLLGADIPLFDNQGTQFIDVDI
jgi:hypothetical protein